MSCKLCGEPGTSAFRHDHVYCPKCGGHEYRGVLVDRDLWGRWMEGEASIPELDPEGEPEMPVATQVQPDMFEGTA